MTTLRTAEPEEQPWIPRARLFVFTYPCAAAGERLFPGVFANPAPIVLDALSRHRSRAALEANLPDATELAE